MTAGKCAKRRQRDNGSHLCVSPWKLDGRRGSRKEVLTDDAEREGEQAGEGGRGGAGLDRFEIFSFCGSAGC